MGRELINIIEQMSKEKGIPKESILGTLESALLSAVRKNYGITPEVSIKIDQNTGEISIKALKKVVENVSNPGEEISLAEARAIDPTKNIGDVIEAPISLANFGRIAAQTAKQVLFQGKGG
jgi:N utilization substance protein A